LRWLIIEIRYGLLDCFGDRPEYAIRALGSKINILADFDRNTADLRRRIIRFQTRQLS